MVPTRWVKFVVAIFLVPICAILSQTFFTVFARATVTQRLWAGEEFWFFSLGAGALADRFLRSAAADRSLRFRTRTDPCALGLADGWTRQPV